MFCARRNVVPFKASAVAMALYNLMFISDNIRYECHTILYNISSAVVLLESRHRDAFQVVRDDGLASFLDDNDDDDDGDEDSVESSDVLIRRNVNCDCTMIMTHMMLLHAILTT